MEEAASHEDVEHTAPRDHVLHAMVVSGWYGATSGELDAPQGVFYRITNDVSEFEYIQDLFSDEIAAHVPVDPIRLLGHFLIEVDGNSEVFVGEYSTKDRLVTDFEELDQFYNDWLDAE